MHLYQFTLTPEGIASLEAKRQFKAPRKSPEHLRSLEKYSHHDGDVSNCCLVGETVEFDLSCRQGSPLESRNNQDGPPVKDSVSCAFKVINSFIQVCFHTSKLLMLFCFGMNVVSFISDGR